MYKNFYIAAIIPPNRAEMEFLKMKRRIFRLTETVSSWALRPMVPFAFFPERPVLPQRRILPCVPSGGISLDDIKVEEGHLVFGSKPLENFCRDLRRSITGAEAIPAAGNTAGFPAVINGLHLLDTGEEGTAGAEKLFKKACADLPREIVVWKNCSLALLYVSAGGDDNHPLWWNRLEIEIIDELKLPRCPA